MIPTPQVRRALVRKSVRSTVTSLLIIGTVLFGTAGRLDWPEAWILMGLVLATSLAGGFWLARHDPALLSERLSSPIQRDQKLWDKVWMVAMLVVSIAWLIVMGLDAGRYRWSVVPLAFKGAGLALIGLGYYLIWLTLKTNSYAAPVVKVQKSRGHLVVTSGPYAYVRHPMYAGALLFITGVPLLLGSWWGLAAGVVLLLILAIRAVFEERTLTVELEGYADYAARTRYRLVPYLW
jgi:protein-S-isoprenylcysteine O-methyltransferase Ste14